MSIPRPVLLWGSSAHDTSPEAARVQVEAWRRMGPVQRFRVALDLSDAAQALTRQGQRARRPDTHAVRIETPPSAES